MKFVNSKSLLMTYSRYIRFLLLSFLLLPVSLAANAQDGADFKNGNTEAYLRALILNNSNELVTLLAQEKKYYLTDPERFYTSMESALIGVVDFKRITLRVMGKYARRSNKEQRQKFLVVFKQSLFKAYAKALVESGEFELNVLSADLNPRSDQRATVDLEIVSDSGNHYPVVYTMYHNKKTKKWLVENVIVSGVNVGLAFRDRFEQQMRLYRNDIDQVIASWTGKLKKLGKKK